MTTLLTVPETLERLRISRMTFYRLVSAGRIRTVHIGTRTFVTERECEAFLASLGRAA